MIKKHIVKKMKKYSSDVYNINDENHIPCWLRLAKSDDAVSACLLYRGPMHGWTDNELISVTKWEKDAYIQSLFKKTG